MMPQPKSNDGTRVLSDKTPWHAVRGLYDVNLLLTPEMPINQKDWIREAMQAVEYRRQEERTRS
jgi:hypothetical protein